MYVYGSKERLFVNSTLGCRSRCSYCYLPSLNYKLNNPELMVKNSEDIVTLVESRTDFIPGKYGTIVSLGCYSECWDELVRDSTLELIEYFLKLGNPVQFATKRYVAYEVIEPVCKHVSWKGQLSVFVSSATLTKWGSVERSTDSPQTRFKSFELTRKLEIPVYLYIKPVIESVTIKDLDKYLNIVKDYSVTGVVVGSKFIKSNAHEKLAPVSDGILRYMRKSNDENVIYGAFAREISTYTESVQAINYWRNYEKDKN